MHVSVYIYVPGAARTTAPGSTQLAQGIPCCVNIRESNAMSPLMTASQPSTTSQPSQSLQPDCCPNVPASQLRFVGVSQQLYRRATVPRLRPPLLGIGRVSNSELGRESLLELPQISPETLQSHAISVSVDEPSGIQESSLVSNRVVLAPSTSSCWKDENEPLCP